MSTFDRLLVAEKMLGVPSAQVDSVRGRITLRVAAPLSSADSVA